MLLVPFADVSISGSNFFPQDPTLRCAVGHMATTSTWLSESSLRCRVPPGVGKSLHARVSVPGALAVSSNVLSFAVPAVSTISAINYPTSGTRVTITGSNFGFSANNVVFQFGSAVASTIWTSDTAIVPLIPSGTGSNLTATVNVGEQHSAVFGSFVSYDNPVISRVVPANLPSAGGSVLIIIGNNFGSSAVPIIRVGLSTCSSPLVFSHTSVACTAPRGVGKSLEIALEVSGLSSAVIGLVSYDSPRVSSVFPASGPTIASHILTITGLNFGGPFEEQAVLIGDKECVAVKAASDSMLLCESSLSVGLSQRVSVSVGNQTGALVAGFSYFSPSISSLSLRNTPAAQPTPFLLFGSNFGALSTSQSSYVGETKCNPTVWISDSSISCRSPFGSGRELAVIVEVGFQNASSVEKLCYDRPVLSSIAPTHGVSAGGFLVTFFGRNFGGSNSSPQGRLGGTACFATFWTSDTSLNCRVRQGFNIAGSFSITTSSGVHPAASTFFVFVTDPVATAVTRLTSPSTGGFSITVFGSFFANQDSSPSFQVGQSRASPSMWTSDSAMLARLPAGIGQDLPLTVALLGGFARLPTTFSYTRMQVSSISFSTSSMVTVSGRFFGFQGFPDFRIRLGPTLCRTSSWVSDSSALCTIPQGSGSNVSLFVLDGNIATSAPNTFSYSPPQVLSTLPVALQGGLSITVLGQLFGSANDLVTVRVGATASPLLRWFSDSSVTALVSAGVSNDLPLLVVIANYNTTASFRVSYASPSLQSISSSVVRINDIVTITGAHFGRWDVTARIRTSATSCEASSWTSESSMSCKVPTGSGILLPISITVANNVGRQGRLFEFISRSCADVARLQSVPENGYFYVMNPDFGTFRAFCENAGRESSLAPSLLFGVAGFFVFLTLLPCRSNCLVFFMDCLGRGAGVSVSFAMERKIRRHLPPCQLVVDQAS